MSVIWQINVFIKKSFFFKIMYNHTTVIQKWPVQAHYVKQLLIDSSQKNRIMDQVDKSYFIKIKLFEMLTY